MVTHQTGTGSSERFASSYGRAAEQALEPGWLARIAARVRAGSLDEALIEGADPTSSRQLAARAAVLASRRSRAEIADGLECLLSAAQGPPRRLRVLPRRAPTLAHALQLSELAALLRGSCPLYVRGIAFVAQLLSDGTGPAYVGDGEALGRRLRAARAALDGREPERYGPSRRLHDGSWIYSRRDSS